jgi:RNA polymerase sigma-70 factor, ECF subfamily
LEDIALVEALRTRQEDAVRLYLQRFRPLFHHCIAQFETEADAREDLYQELCWYALERLDRDSFDAKKGTLGTWLYRVAWCRCVDLKRQQNARRKLRLQTAEDGLPDRADPSPGPRELVGEAEIGALVREALTQIDKEDRALLELRFVDGLILPELASRLDISVEQAKYRLKRASTNLRRALLQQMPREEAVE